MGGGWEQFRGRTKIEAWLKFERFRNAERDSWSVIDPFNKKEAKRQMVRDEAVGEWVLNVRLSK